MSGPYFETWSHENLVKFAKEAYAKLQRQEEELQRLRWPERLAQPLGTHWEGCEEVHPECRKPEQEPVAWVTGWHDGHCVIRAANPAAILPIGIALYTTPPRREWVGLTGEELDLIARTAADLYDAALKTEAKLREKNS